ncbi:MAG: branched-chain amino acid ABC transporter permease [Burkholderiales bacterium]|nr:branched-chain amino acid ABC transporter permease [Burkholderiales bacterium]
MNRSRTLAVLAALVAAALPAALSDFWIFIAIEVIAFALYAVSFNVLLGYGGMLSFGHAAFFGVGAYAGALMVRKSGFAPEAAFALAPLAAMAAAAAVAAVVGFFSVRRSGIYFGMLTFAFQMLLYTIALKATGLTGGDDGITGLKPPGALARPAVYYVFALATVGPALYVLYRLVNSPFGITLRALKANPRRVQYVGVDVRSHQLAAFVVSGAFAGLAGAVFALSSGNVFPAWLNWTASATPIVMAVLGGVSSFLGPALGAAVYVVLEVVISGRTEYWPLVMGVIILALVLLMPAGLTGLWRRRGAP